MEALALQTGAPTVHLEDNTSFIYVVEGKSVTPRVNHIDIPVRFIQENVGNGIFQTMISLVSCRKICAPNHVQVQLSVGVING